MPQSYINALLTQLQSLPSRPETLYFGGGTPSLLSPEQATRLITAANPAPGAEVTLEANPETVSEQTLHGFLQAGVNRLSLGVQTARDESLSRLGRPHTATQSKAALAAAKAAGFTNISGDIMLALPHYSNAEFDETLALLAEGDATHISAYLLKIEPGTPFSRQPPQGLPGDDEAAGFYLYAVEQLAKAGYAQYEISNFAKPGFEGRHNLIYWNCGDYLGLGPAAHSCMASQRRYWPADTAGFIAGTLLQVEDGLCDAQDFIMLQLRLASGLSLSRLKKEYNVEFSKKQLQFVEKCVSAGYASFEGDALQLTPRGLIVQNSILCELLA